MCIVVIVSMNLRYKVPEYIVRNLQAPLPDGCGYQNPTPVQMQCWSILLKERELLACSATGSGKTAAFVVPILTLLKVSHIHLYHTC